MLRIHTIALELALCGGMAVAAGAQAANSAPKSDTTVVTSGNRHQMRRGATERGDRGLFRGIDLSGTQRARLDSIRAKYRAESKPLRDQMMPAMREARAARQSGDSAKLQAARKDMSASREKMRALHNQELAEIRGVLTPEQQATFDKNASEVRERMRAKGSQRHGRHRGGDQGA